MFENLPEFSKFQKIYNDKIKEEEMKQKLAADQDDGAPEKWKMKFAKDERQGDSKQKSQTKQQFGFNYESEEEDQAKKFQIHAPVPTTIYGAASTSGYDKARKVRSPIPKPKLEVAPIPTMNPIPKGQVVLDKFGNFRLADPVQAAPPKPLEAMSSTRRSRSNSRFVLNFNLIHKVESFIFLERFRSPRRRRRSGSYRRRYSRSRSYSRFTTKVFPLF